MLDVESVDKIIQPIPDKGSGMLFESNISFIH